MHGSVGNDVLLGLTGQRVGHIGIDQTGADTVDADIVSCPCLCQAPRHGDDGRFGGRVVHLVLTFSQGRNRGQSKPPARTREQSFHLSRRKRHEKFRPD